MSTRTAVGAARALTTNPAALGYRWPAEWEPHAATWLAWPHKQESWPGRFDAVPGVFVEMVRTLVVGERVEILVRDQAMRAEVARLLADGGVPQGRVGLHEIATNDAWIRDHGPIFLTRTAVEGAAPGQAQTGAGAPVVITDWGYNSWGGKYPPWDADDAVPLRVAELLGMPAASPAMILEGGSIDGNGRGAVLTTQSCLLNHNRNPELSREQIEERLRLYLGAKKILWLGDGIAGDDTDGHVDDLARFVSPDTVVTVVEDDTDDENYRPLQENLARLRSMTDQDDRSLRVVELPMPAPIEVAGQRVPASYANFYIANAAVLVPVFGDPADERALSTLRSLFPDRAVVGLVARDLVWGLGAFHCATQQQPAVGRGAG